MSAVAENDNAPLLDADKRFDPDVNLLWDKSYVIKYHTQLPPGIPVHPTRESAAYAAALLDSSELWRRERGAAIVSKLLDLQDTNPANKTCGIWSWYYEEPLPQMAPPDWNWADFVGVQLMHILLANAPEELPDGLYARIQNALRFAAGSIRHRDVPLSYTNIAIMGTYVMVMAGHELDDPNLLAYGRDKLRKFVAFTREFGGFPEYNSPNYTTIAVSELSRMMRDFPLEDERALVREVLDRAWSEIALHWHAPSRQWAGPHSRSYSTMLTPEQLSFIQHGLGNRASVAGTANAGSLPPLSPDLQGLQLRCPDHLIHYFQDEKPRSHLVVSLSPGKPAIEGHTHMAPEFTLSSVERGTFWNQFRVVSAYAPGKSPEVPTAFAMRFLHDGYDFSALNILTRQHDACVLAAACLAHDGGDKHPLLDIIQNATISAEDWRLRLEFTDPIDAEALARLKLDSNRVWRIPFGKGATLSLRWLRLAFGDCNPPRLEISGNFAQPDSSGHQRLTINVDLVFYKGDRRDFHFNPTFMTAIAYGLSIHDKTSGVAPDLAAISVSQTEDYLDLNWPAYGMKLSSPLYPQKEADIISWTTDQKR
ncbi:hypothetical protein DB346_02355 [Verrucomicrobia bacterium LW23]|nr:hypothetical protein DB346_02355 [Verrucomicrobia bacterium LW23]